MSLFVLVAAVGMAVATGGAATPLVVGAFAIAGTAGLVVYSREISEKLSSLKTEMAKLSAEDAIILALEQAGASIKSLVDQADEARKGVSP